MSAVPQPSGTVTLVFSDIEGSTKLLHELGTEAYKEALAEHRRIVREAYARYSGYEVDYEGDAFFYAFASAADAVKAVSEAMAGLKEGPIAIRVGIHTGEPSLDPPKYVGLDVHFAARVMSSAHGGQVVLSAATASLVDLPLTDLGEHRLKDIEGAVSIFQLGDGAFPPLKTISNTNLPRPASSFLGREVELQEVLSRIEQGARLVTLTGPGGTGKTRLALEAATSLVPEYKAGVFWVGLASLRDPALVTETISQVLGAKDGLAEHIHERELCLLLDNLEQVIEAAPELSALLESCPNLTLLVTSRELLRIQGEVEYPVPPLASAEAVELFCARAQLEPSDEIAELCLRLDSLPLAVELAAARTKALTPSQILERLSQRLDLLKGGRDADPRQQTLRATIEWSYDLLTPEEQALFAALSVFAGGCTLEAAEEVAGADLDTLQSLVEKSLLRFTNERYWMLETVREYAALVLLADADGSVTTQRYAACFVALASELGGEHVWLNADAASMERLDAETPNFRAVLRLLADDCDGERMLEVAVGLASYWLARGQLHEGRMWVESALALSDTKGSKTRARALSNAADLCMSVGDLDGARLHASESLYIAEQLGEPLPIAQALHDLGEIASDAQDFEQAKGYYEQAIRRAKEANYPAPGSIGNLANIALAEGDYDRARELSARAAEIFRSSNNQLGLATALFNQSSAALSSGELVEARSALRESLGLCVELRYSTLGVLGVQASAAILVRTNRAQEAAALFGAGERLLGEMGLALEPAERELQQTTKALIRHALTDGDMAVARDHARSLTLDDAMSLALASL